MHKLASIGVVVGRFQVPALHAGHRYLIEYALEKHANVLVVIGESRALPSVRNPLPYALRASMIATNYPTVRIASLCDQRQDSGWSMALDALIAREYRGARAVLYGSRDSFLNRYFGEHKKEKVPNVGAHNGTALREEILRGQVSPEFRRGHIHAITNRSPHVYQTVDVAVLDRGRILLAAKREDGGKLRFIGGFVDPTDKSLELAASRECFEETGGLGVHEMHYIGSTLVDDWRYRDSDDRVMTALYRTEFMFGGPRPSDDVDMLVWKPLKGFKQYLVGEHQPLAELLLADLAKKRKRKEKS